MVENAQGLADESNPPAADPLSLSLAAFHSAEAEGMMLKYRHVEQLIGRGTHGLSEGTYCENLVREFLRKVLPGRYSVDTGFIRGRETEVCGRKRHVSDQLDIIVHDTHDFAPIFRSEGFVVVIPDAVAAVIEVKKALTSERLKDALENLAIARFLAQNSCPNQSTNVFTGIVAFTSERMAPESKAFSETYTARLLEIGRLIPPMYSIPEVISVIDREILHRGYKDNLEEPFGVLYRRSSLGGVNVACQSLLCSMLLEMRVKELDGENWHRFAFPDGFEFHDVLSCWKPTELIPPKGADPRQDFSSPNC
jgi:hypothetical protein